MSTIMVFNCDKYPIPNIESAPMFIDVVERGSGFILMFQKEKGGQ